MGGASQLVDFRVDVETHQRESLRKAGAWEGPDEDTMSGMGNSGGVEGGQAAEGGDGGRRHGAYFYQDPPRTPQSMKEDEGMLQSGGGP